MYPIVKKEKLADKIYLMDVKAERVAKTCMPGQFIIVKIDEEGERIPLTICDYDREAGTITIVFQVVGASTQRMTGLEVGDSFRDFVGPLGCASEFCSEEIEDLVKDGNTYDVCVAIGPMIMMKFVCLLTKKLEIPTIVSMNPIMVDGTGMCGACRLTVGDEVKFACVDGPEFDGHLVDFDQAMKRQQMYKTEEGRAMLKLQEGDTHHGGCGHCGGDK